MTDLEKTILATIIYYDVLDFPLTFWETAKFLINPKRVSPGGSLGVFDFHDVVKSIANLVNTGEIEELNGFYFLPGRKNLYQERIEKNKIAEVKWKKARRYLWWIQCLPYMEAVFASGSLALGHTGYDSDLDVLVVSKPGHIWLARLFISLAMSFLGVRRRDGELIAPDKICLNHYITSDSLRIPFPSLYNAQTYAHLVPVYFKDQRIIEKFWRANDWVLNFLNTWEMPDLYQKREVRRSVLLRLLSVISEKVLEMTRAGFVLEKLARKVQKKRINQDLPGRITVSDEQLEFHPYSIERKIIKSYNERISSLDLFHGYQEVDSGLK